MQSDRDSVQIVVKQVRVGVQRDLGRLVSKQLAHPRNQPKPNPAKLDPLQLEKRDHALGLGLRLGERRHRGGDLGQHLLALAGR
jgi:hypothetical protein